MFNALIVVLPMVFLVAAIRYAPRMMLALILLFALAMIIWL